MKTVTYVVCCFVWGTMSAALGIPLIVAISAALIVSVVLLNKGFFDDVYPE